MECGQAHIVRAAPQVSTRGATYLPHRPHGEELMLSANENQRQFFAVQVEDDEFTPGGLSHSGGR